MILNFLLVHFRNGIIFLNNFSLLLCRNLILLFGLRLILHNSFISLFSRFFRTKVLNCWGFNWLDFYVLMFGEVFLDWLNILLNLLGKVLLECGISVITFGFVSFSLNNYLFLMYDFIGLMNRLLMFLSNNVTLGDNIIGFFTVIFWRIICGKGWNNWIRLNVCVYEFLDSLV